MSEDVYV